MITNWNDKMTFGKYKGYTAKEVFENDASYLQWIMVNTDKTDFIENIKDTIKKRMKEIESERYEDLSWGDFYT